MVGQPAQLDDSKPVVLIVDDSLDVHRLLKARLRTEDLDFISAMNGAEGLQAAITRQPSLILLDLDMPSMDGFEVMRALKDNSETVQIPVIVLSGLQSVHDKVTAFDLGAVDYVTKPFDLAELRVRLLSALRLNRLVKMLAQRAQIDGLTGLWNRAFFDRRWSEEHARSLRHPRPLSLAMIDLDHFKSINDSFGHPAGNTVLQGVAKILSRELRSSDSLCRYGGEEFTLIMPDTSPENAAALCDRLRQAVQGAAWPRHPERPVTFSCGVAGTDTATTVTPERWVEIVDANLYAAKRSGRNRVISSDVNQGLVASPRLTS